MNDKILTLFSSNHTLQYEKDVFSVLSLPRGCEFQFRYEKDYVEDSVKTIFLNDRDISKYKALVAFRSASEINEPESFIIPIRWVRIDRVESNANSIWSVYFITEGYPKFTYEYSNLTTTDQLSSSAELIFKSFSKRDLAVLPNTISSVELDENKSTEDRDKENWFDIIKRIAILSKYKKMHFLRCTKFYGFNESLSKIYNNVVNSRIEMIEKKPAYIDVEYYSIEYNKSDKNELEVFVNDKILNKTNGLKNSLDSRYGTKTIGFQPQSVPNNTYTEIVISTKTTPTSQDLINTELSFPIIVAKNKSYRALKAFVMALGGLFVALPGIIDTNLFYGWNIVLATIGVAILGIGSYWESEE